MGPLMKVAIGLVVVVVILWAGFFMWERSLASSLGNLEDERKAVISERDAALETKVNTLHSLISAYEGLVVQHRNWSRLFQILEDRTLGAVTFISFEGDYTKNAFVLEGRAPNYRTLAEQIQVFENAQQLTGVEVGDIALTQDGQVGFILTVQFKKDVITGTPTDILLPAPSPEETATTSATSTQ